MGRHKQQRGFFKFMWGKVYILLTTKKHNKIIRINNVNNKRISFKFWLSLWFNVLQGHFYIFYIFTVVGQIMASLQIRSRFTELLQTRIE